MWFLLHTDENASNADDMNIAGVLFDRQTNNRNPDSCE